MNTRGRAAFPPPLLAGGAGLVRSAIHRQPAGMPFESPLYAVVCPWATLLRRLPWPRLWLLYVVYSQWERLRSQRAQQPSLKQLSRGTALLGKTTRKPPLRMSRPKTRVFKISSRPFNGVDERGLVLRAAAAADAR